ncbi:hypothetical protein BH11MYX1_BH11MYX1_33000 [soil metagenome]
MSAKLCLLPIVVGLVGAGCVVGDGGVADDVPDNSSSDAPSDVPYLYPNAAQSGAVRSFSGGDFKAALEQLRPGDTLNIAPGIYDLGTPTNPGIAPILHSGTAEAPILVQAADPSNWPHFRGQLVLNHPDFYIFKRLRIEGVRPPSGRVPSSSVTMAGGNHWTLVNVEIWGATSTGAFANLSISTEVTPTKHWNPNGWRLINSCIHDAGPGTAPGHDSVTDHNVYVNSEGTGPDGGLIAHNIFFGAYNGSQIKIGNGGDPLAPSADHISIEYNTMHHATRHVALFGHSTTRITVKGNLMKAAEGRDPDQAYRDGISLQQLSSSSAANVHDNYVHGAEAAVGLHGLPGGVYVAPSPDTNRLFNAAADDPRFNAAGCGGTGDPRYVPANPRAARFGRYSTVAY